MAADTDPAAHREVAPVTVAQQRRLYRVAVAVCGDPDLAEEAVAEAIARSWPALRDGRVENPPAYLRRAVLNVLHGRFRRLALERRARARRTVEGRTAPDAAAGVTERDVVMRALRQLPERQRAVVALRFYEGLSEAEIARELGVPAGTVKSAASRAMARLRELLEEDRHD